MKLAIEFFNQSALDLARNLLGKVIRHYYQGLWLQAQIIETESYELEDKASHAFLGFTEKRKALYMPPGTIYMYYARGGDSLNISAQGSGSAVLIKSAIVYIDNDKSITETDDMLLKMQQLNPLPNNRQRDKSKLLSGQTLLCKSLGLKVKQWDQKQFNQQLYVKDVGYQPDQIIQTERLGIPPDRDPHLPYRFIDMRYVKMCTKNPLTTRKILPYNVITA